MKDAGMTKEQYAEALELAVPGIVQEMYEAEVRTATARLKAEMEESRRTD